MTFCNTFSLICRLYISFDLMDKLLEMQDLFKNSDIVTYDYLAPVEGEVKTV